MNNTFLNVTSEIGRLNTVLLHRPGRELENLSPRYLDEMLFEDIPYLKRIREEHDMFAGALSARGCNVLYYSDLLRDILNNNEARVEIIEQALTFCSISFKALKEQIKEYMLGLSSEKLADVLIAGLHKDDIPHSDDKKRLSYYIKEQYPFYLSPLPNLYFTRDPGAVIADGLCVNTMKTPARNRESMLLGFFYKYHDSFQNNKKTLWYDYNELDSIEGGDILVLGSQTVAIGCSARTSTEAIEKLAERLFARSGVQEVLVIQIPFVRAYMHLDTVFTMVDYDKFTIYPGIESHLRLFSITAGKNGGLAITEKNSLSKALCDSLGLSAVSLIQSGGGLGLTAEREQWNDSTNTLAIAPGTVVTYNRNQVSNETLRKNGIEVVEIEGSELVRGRGGPRCMSMPLNRDDL